MPIDAYRMKLIFLNFDPSTKPTAGHLNIAVLGSVRYSFSQLRPPRLLSAQIHSLTPQIMPSGPLREVGVGGARRVLHSNEIRYSRKAAL
jgi:hypothetical protein